MQSKLLEILICPKCQSALTLESPKTEADGEITSGTLKCQTGGEEYKIAGGIPRFVPPENYASSFGLQWNLFKSEQLDSQNGFNLSEKRFFDETSWEREWMAGKLILDAGCGAGRFLDASSKTDAEIVGVDLSNAVDAAKSNTAGRKNVHIVQASIYELPFRKETFDGVYCIGVVQHTPDPKKTMRCAAKMVKKGGRLAFFIYEKRRWTKFYSKYLIRPFTKRLKSETLLKVIKVAMPILFPITEVAFRIPVVGKIVGFMIPVSNYVGINVKSNQGLDIKQRYRWALMDTFDMLAPEYDEPQTFEEVRELLTNEGIVDLHRTANSGLCLDGRKGLDDEMVKRRDDETR